MNTVSPLPDATTSERAAVTTARIPNRSMSAAANGEVRPYRAMFTENAVEIVVTDQPNSSRSGSMNTPGTDRKPAAPTSARKVTAATHHAGWIRRTCRSVTPCSIADLPGRWVVARKPICERIRPCMR